MIDEFRSVDRTELSHAFKYLTQYHLKGEQLDRANHYAQKCLQFDETKEEAKILLRTIAEKRAKVEETSMVVSNENFIAKLIGKPILLRAIVPGGRHE